MSTLAVIPARSGSKRLPGKNLLPFHGVPLIAWSIRFARQMPQFDKVVVSTDSPDIARLAEKEGIDVPWLRPSELASDTATSTQVVLHVLERERAAGNAYDRVALLQPTSPVRFRSRWHQGFELLEDEQCDAVIGVSPMHIHPFHGFDWSHQPYLKAYGDAEQLRLRTQDLPVAVHVNGALYLIRTGVLEREHSFFPRRSCGVLCDDPVEAIDIDSEADFVIGQSLVEHFGIADE